MTRKTDYCLLKKGSTLKGFEYISSVDLRYDGKLWTGSAEDMTKAR